MNSKMFFGINDGKDKPVDGWWDKPVDGFRWWDKPIDGLRWWD